MIYSRIACSLLAMAGFAAMQGTAIAAPMVFINKGLTNECDITPTPGTVFTISTQGDVLVTGSYTSGACGSQQSGGGSPTTPTFTPFNPAPADLTIASSSLGSAGGNVTPTFTVHYANTCTGSATPSTGCTAIPAPWGTGGAVCTGTTPTGGQLYCSPSGAVAVPANPSTTTACTYAFRAHCVNTASNAAIDSQIANVTVAPQGVTVGCTQNDPSGDLAAFGYSRQCAGTVHSLNTSLSSLATWNNSYQGLMSGVWPGNSGQMGFGLQVTVNATQYGSFKFNTGSTAAGVHFEANNSYGQTGLMSVSTVPGDFFSGTALCVGTSLNISSKTGTLAQCKLSLNTDYFVNISMAGYASPHDTTCGAGSCTTGWTTYSYGN